MFADDDGGEDAATGATRYPVMPSLVALQQMRARLHMAQLGRKLMKWTSVAAAAELRRISADLQAVYKTFGADMKEAFLLLARCRYFFPDVNKMVINDVQNKASVMVSSNTKTVSGVRIIQYHIVELDTPYDYLGLGAGGETIEEAKRAWVKLLKLQILMVELRRSFLIVEDVYKTATKRLNVINKIVIPRTKASTKYIQLELEEVAREELHRIKKIQAFKKKRRQGLEKKDKPQTCPICSLPVVEEEKPAPPPRIRPSKVKLPPQTPPPPKAPTPTPPPSRPPAPSPAPIPPPPISAQFKEKPSELIAVHEPITESRREMFKPICSTDKPSKVTRGLSPISHLSLGDSGVSKVEQLKEMLDTTISLGEDVARTDTGSVKMDEVLKLCQEAKQRLDQIGDKKQVPNAKIVKDLEHLKLHIREVIEVTRDLRDITFLSPSVENFVKTCENVDEKLTVAMKNVETAEVNEHAKHHLMDLKDEINDVLKVIADYRNEGLLTQSAEDFETVCKETKSKIDCYTNKSAPSANEQKLEHLKSHLNTLETLTTDVKRTGLRSASIERFLASCKDFKQKLEHYKTQGENPISRLISQIEQAVKSTQEAKKEGFVSGNVDGFIKSCEKFKTNLEIKNKEIQDKDEIMELISNLESQGFITESTAEFLRMCEDTKQRVDLDSMMYSLDAQSRSILSPECGALCTCQSDRAQELCDTCKDLNEPPEKTKSVTIDPSCNPCHGFEEQVQNDPCSDCKVPEVPCSDCHATYPPDLKGSVCKVCSSQAPSAQTSEPICCSQAPSAQSSEPICCTSVPLSEKQSCAVCEAASEDDQKENDEEEFGMFEKKVKTITKITRYKTETGDIREEKEVTTIKKVKHDPNETEIECEESSSDESYDVGMCITPTQNQIGFRNRAQKSKSEQIFRVSSLTRPHFRHCISFHPQVCFVRTPSQHILFNSGQLSSTTSLCLFQTPFV